MEQPGYRTHKVQSETRADGTIILRSAYEMSSVAETTADWLRAWAGERPDTIFLAERSGPGWRTVSYAETLQRVQALAAALLERRLDGNTPILILSGNGIDHALLSLAAHHVGIPTVPVAEQYSLIPGAQAQLRYVIGLIGPAMVFAEDGDKFATALAMDDMRGREIVVSRGGGEGVTRFADLLKGGTADVEAANAGVGPDTVAKILMTSGSTSNPKGVLTTQAMLCANQAQYADALPFLKNRPPRLVDWLPWNHVFGGSNDFNLVLANGGSLYIDDGKPAKGPFERSIENNLLMNATIAFNVPVGFTLMRDAMRENAKLKQRFFEDLDMLFYAGASLPQDVWHDLREMAIEVRGQAPMMTTCWGMTETAPACIFQHEPSSIAGIVGVPLTGVTVKLVPEEGERFDVRVKGANITPGYFNDPERTAEAFDEEGFFITGDAMTLTDPDDMAKGLRFDGRIAEDFKLQTGVWVRAAALRLELLVALAGLASDVVVTGEGHREVGLMIVPVPGTELRDDGGIGISEELAKELRIRLTRLAKAATGSSNRITRALILSEPPSMAEGEITAKGNLNFRKLLTRRADLLTRLYDDRDPAVLRVDY